MLHDFLWTYINSHPVISPQMVNMMSEGKIRCFTITVQGSCRSSRRLAGVLPLGEP